MIAQVLDDVKEERHHALRKVFGEKAYYDTLEDVLIAYRRKTGVEAMKYYD